MNPLQAMKPRWGRQRVIYYCKLVHQAHHMQHSWCCFLFFGRTLKQGTTTWRPSDFWFLNSSQAQHAFQPRAYWSNGLHLAVVSLGTQQTLEGNAWYHATTWSWRNSSSGRVLQKDVPWRCMNTYELKRRGSLPGWHFSGWRSLRGTRS